MPPRREGEYLRETIQRKFAKKVVSENSELLITRRLRSFQETVKHARFGAGPAHRNPGVDAKTPGNELISAGRECASWISFPALRIPGPFLGLPAMFAHVVEKDDPQPV